MMPMSLAPSHSATGKASMAVLRELSSPEGKARARDLSKSLLAVTAASRVLAVRHAQAQQSATAALLTWAEATRLIAWVESAAAESPAVEAAAEEQQGEAAGSDIGFLELVLLHTRSNNCAAAFNQWVRAANALVAESARSGLRLTAQECKWALQRALDIEATSRSRLLQSVLRWWNHGDVSRAFALWTTAATGVSY